MLSDINQTFGSDILTTPAGDLATVSGSSLGVQRIYRRLMTNPGTYIQNPNYGAGLPLKVGQALSTGLFDEVKSAVISNIFLEQRVAKTPPPDIKIQEIFNGISIYIVYFDIATNQLEVLSFNVNI